jgi:hypothetical protein
MNKELTFLIISSTNDQSILETLESIYGVGEILIIDGGPRKGVGATQNNQVNLQEIANRFGAAYLANPYVNSANQYNFGIASIKTKWTFILDSDETIDAELKGWLLDANNHTLAHYEVKRYNYFLTNKIKHGHLGPDKQIRFFVTRDNRYESRAVHARLITTGTKGKTPGYLSHMTIPSIELFLSKMIVFTGREKLARGSGNESNELIAVIKRNAQKLPLQPTLRFCYSYFLKFGFMDGILGFQLAKCASFYETIVNLRKYEN